ncbi:molybdenum cofactor sulfurase-like [Watersipora subatra]|uniref:molybdenum cofactor sulfurase-like n=1 Tax=Watersipora subatra TaxID=2589382 RepID=UPI00355C4469
MRCFSTLRRYATTVECGILIPGDATTAGVETLDCGKEASLWISDVLALTGCRLVRQLSNQSLANDSQYLLISRDSVKSLCDYITDQMNCSAIVEEVAERFRANLMVSGCQPDEESKWSHIQIGQHMLKCIGECERCSLISIDYDTGEMTKEPLRSLTTRKGAKPTFGIHVVNTNFKQGRLKVGDVFHTVD